MTRAEDVTTSREDVGRVPRTRGAVSGFLLVLLGIWGALVPFVGPYLGLPYGFDDPWVFTGERVLLNVVPGVAVVFGGIGLIASSRATGGVFWGWLAALGGAWFVSGPTVSTLWTSGESAVGAPLATSAAVRAFTEFVYHLGLGSLVIFLAAAALGRFTAGTGRTVVSAVPQQDRGAHDDLSTPEYKTDSTTDRLHDRSGDETTVMARPDLTKDRGIKDRGTPARDTEDRNAVYDQDARDTGKHRVTTPAATGQPTDDRHHVGGTGR